MKKSRKLVSFLIFLLVSSMLVSMSGCVVSKDKGDNNTNKTSTTDSTVKDTPKPTKLTVLWSEESVANDVNQYLASNEVFKHIEKQTNVDVEIIAMSGEKLNVTIAGGDLPDVVCTVDDVTKHLVDAKMILDLDPLLLTNGKDILGYAPNRLDTARAKFDGKLYYMTPNATGPKDGFIPPMNMTIYPTMRWDYYKELGYPEMKNTDDLLDVLKRMVDNHPVTESGKKVYAFGAWNDWDDFWYYNMLGLISGTEMSGDTAYLKYADDETLRSNYLDSESQLWQTLRFMNKANTMGILHPDTFTMKNQDYAAALLKGEIIYAPATWDVKIVNAELLKKGTSFTCIPLDFGWTYGNVRNVIQDSSYKGGAGWGGKNWAITTNCKAPEKAMDFLNYCFSKRGSREINSGLEGVHWEMVNGKPQMKPEVVQAKMKGGDEWQKLSLIGSVGALGHIAGMGANVICDDGAPVNLFSDPSTYKQMLNPVEKEFSDHYGVGFPYEAWVKKVEEGKIEHRTHMPKNVRFPDIPDDIKRINLKCSDIISKNLASCILEPKTEAEFTKIMNKVMADLKAADAEKSWDWAAKTYGDARAKAYGN